MKIHHILVPTRPYLPAAEFNLPEEPDAETMEHTADVLRDAGFSLWQTDAPTYGVAQDIQGGLWAEHGIATHIVSELNQPYYLRLAA